MTYTDTALAHKAHHMNSPVTTRKQNGYATGDRWSFEVRRRNDRLRSVSLTPHLQKLSRSTASGIIYIKSLLEYQKESLCGFLLACWSKPSWMKWVLPAGTLVATLRVILLCGDATRSTPDG